MQNDAQQNPYCFTCGEITVTVKFAETAKPLDSLLIEYFTNVPQQIKIQSQKLPANYIQAPHFDL